MNFKLILEVELMFPDARGTTRLTKQHIECVKPPKQEIGHRVARVGGGEADAASLREVGVELPIHLVPFVAPFQRVSVMNPAHGVAEVPVPVVLAIEVGGCDAEESRHADADTLAVDAGRNLDA